MGAFLLLWALPPCNRFYIVYLQILFYLFTDRPTNAIFFKTEFYLPLNWATSVFVSTVGS